MLVRITEICGKFGWNEYFAREVLTYAEDAYLKTDNATDFQAMLFARFKRTDMTRDEANKLATAITTLYLDA